MAIKKAGIEAAFRCSRYILLLALPWPDTEEDAIS